jgi:hypothetical protein
MRMALTVIASIGWAWGISLTLFACLFALYDLTGPHAPGESSGPLQAVISFTVVALFSLPGWVAGYVISRRLRRSDPARPGFPVQPPRESDVHP